MPAFLLATRNAHKTQEFAEILGPDFAVSDLTHATDLPEIDETGESFEENAILKAVTISRFVSGLVAADDSGLAVTALGGAPGIYSARYAGPQATDTANTQKLLTELRESDSREARFICVIALARDGETLSVMKGEIAGAIAHAARGGNGFGYDPVFVPDGFDQTFAELGAEVKNRISHRAQAIERLREVLRTMSEPTPPSGRATTR